MIYIDFITYFFKAKNAHSIHSPFVFDFYNQVLKTNTQEQVFFSIEEQRTKLLKSTEKINVIDLGAGSKVNSNSTRYIREIAQFSLKKPKWAQLIYRAIKKYQYHSIIDLGTSLGITTAYIAKANPNARVFTFDACKGSINVANEVFEELSINNIAIVQGNIDNTLSAIVESLEYIDMVFFDANHTYESTLNYFNICLSKAKSGSCFILDDIYWSDQMKKAWNEIIQNTRITFSLDLFEIGLAFIDMPAQKQHFILK